jgi:hypothetical protein
MLDPLSVPEDGSLRHVMMKAAKEVIDSNEEEGLNVSGLWMDLEVWRWGAEVDL